MTDKSTSPEKIGPGIGLNPKAVLDLTKIIRAVVKEEMKNYQHSCRFDITDTEVKEFNAFVGMMGDVGDGRLGSGIGVMRDNHMWLKKQRERSDKLSTAFFVILLAGAIGGVLTAFWEGIKRLVMMP